ncbi:MAG TPA: hypothetical protein VMV27_03820 [Candidatus Binataceae bacterium]|nr:hypothetical protein [Candidatus Binataceae bacterium]
MAALQYAPLALQGAADAGSAMIQTASHAVGASQSNSADDAASAGNDGAGGGCAQLRREPPGVIELRTGAAATPEYRELRPRLDHDLTLWTPLADDDSGADGWRTAVNFMQMGFHPPLGPAVPPGGSVYMAYAPAKTESWSQQDHRASLTQYFGPPAGSFNWNNHAYDYVLVNALPCFPPPR